LTLGQDINHYQALQVIQAAQVFNIQITKLSIPFPNSKAPALEILKYCCLKSEERQIIKIFFSFELILRNPIAVRSLPSRTRAVPADTHMLTSNVRTSLSRWKHFEFILQSDSDYIWFGLGESITFSLSYLQQFQIELYM